MNQVNSPFKFLDSYQQADADVFFGREKETIDLYGALSGVKHLLVYGPSGSGKTSLVECGLRNQFSDADWYALSIRRSADINASVFASINKALKDQIALDPITRMPVDPEMEFGHAVEKLFTERYQPVYLLFDQFEELLISGLSNEKSKFFISLNKLIRNKLPCRILLIMREEFIGHLSEFEALCPSIFQYRFRVEKMGRKNVEEVIYQILEAPKYRAYFNVKDSRKLAESILSKLPDKKMEIELAHVQVFLGELWGRALNEKKNDDRLPLLSVDLVHNGDDLETILESFLRKQMGDLNESFGENVPLELLAAMITDKFTKLQLSEAAIAADLAHKKVIAIKPVADLLKDLEYHRIIRTLKIGDEAQYEISHDLLALVVGQNLTEEMKMREKADDIYKVYGERQGLFTQDDIDYLRPFEQNLSFPPDLQKRIDESIDMIKKKRDKERKRQRAIISIVSVAAVVAVVFALFGLFMWQKAQVEAERAILEAAKAKLQTQKLHKALDSVSVANMKFEEADKNRKAIQINSLLQKAKSYESLDEKKLAITTLEEALKIDSKNVDVNTYLQKLKSKYQ
ncbi:AAA family ATPase [Pedobacter sp. HMF7647]|uniref:AAA family ATPase n=1 Tax=Hufsiella arboris TaxID=2695275 RepID=A0A7K1YDK7_9SPHI|nr:ATP-binding protein [Hufsiella arboris]MXV52684.1 AAA family ATPase [Hufsiella arboris]